MNAPYYFVDTNLLVYACDGTNSTKQQQALTWLTFLWQSRRGRLSAQVLNEFYVVVTQKLKPGLDKFTARLEINNFMTWQPLAINTEVIKQAWQIQDDFQLSWWDSLIVASAQIMGCQYLLSEDLQHHQNLHNVKVINPFLVSVESIS